MQLMNGIGAMTKRIIAGQFHVADTELSTFNIGDILAKLEAAQKLAGLNRLLLLPSHSKAVTDAIIRFCRERGIELYLWYKVSMDNDIQPEHGELTVSAWGSRGKGETGQWKKMFDTEENFRFACPRNKRYNQLLLNRCGDSLERYDGLFLDYTGFPLPSLGLEAIFTCFCRSCVEAEPRLLEWKRRVHDYRNFIPTATDQDLERWGTFMGTAEEFDLLPFSAFRKESITLLAARYEKLARGMGKGFGIDVLCPALAPFAGHDLAALGKLADWIKPRIYCNVYGPSSIPLEFNRLAAAIRSWGGNYSTAALMKYIERSIGIKMPKNMLQLPQIHFPPETIVSEVSKTVAAVSVPVHPSVECAPHPEYESTIDDVSVRNSAASAKSCQGAVLAWNFLFAPDPFLRIVGETLS